MPSSSMQRGVLARVLVGPDGFVGRHLRAQLGEAFVPFEGDVLDSASLARAIRQISGRSSLGFHDLVRLDFYYIENWSIWLDVSILAKTIPAVIRGTGAY